MRILTVEDNRALSELLAKGLIEAGFDVDAASDAADASHIIASTRYSAIVLDLGLPDDDGLSVLKEMRGRGDSTPVLVLTARAGLRDRVSGLRSGADDYVVKPFDFEELVARLQALMRRPSDLVGRLLRVGNLSFDTVHRHALVDVQPCYFSARETSVLELLMRRAGRVVPKSLVEDHLFGISEPFASNAIEVYVHRLRKQLADVGAKAQIHTVRGVGYLIKATEP